MEWWHLYTILGIVIIAAVTGFYFLRKKFKKKMEDQETLLNQHKVSVSILVLEKRMDKVSNANIPKSVQQQIPKIYKIRKVPIVKAKVGSQVLDLLCDEKIFDKIPDKKTIRVDLAGIFIADIKQGKSKK